MLSSLIHDELSRPSFVLGLINENMSKRNPASLNTQHMAQNYTRESLRVLEAWQAIGASEPLCHEMQTLCLMYVQKPDRKKFLAETESCRDTACAMEATMPMPPPQRRGRATSLNSLSKYQQLDKSAPPSRYLTCVTQCDVTSIGSCGAICQ